METTILAPHSAGGSTVEPIAPDAGRPRAAIPEISVDSKSSVTGIQRVRQSTYGWHVVPRKTGQRVDLLEASATDQEPVRANRGMGLSHVTAHILQEWEGIVERVDETSFTARLFDGNYDFPVKRADIPIEEVEEQREKVRPGASFTWFIGYRIRGKVRTRMSEITFRKLPSWSAEEVKAAKIEGEKLGEAAGWDSTRNFAAA